MTVIAGSLARHAVARDFPDPELHALRGHGRVGGRCASERRSRSTRNAPAEAVWQIVGPGFATSVAGPARSVPPSHTSPGDDLIPCPGRVCDTGLRFAPRVAETVVAYGGAERTLTCEGSGLPRFVAAARNRWRVAPLSPRRCHFSLDAAPEPRGLARIAAPVLRLALAREGRRLVRDLKHYAEHAEVSPHKRQRP
jgi:hypothetical protein